MKKLITTLVLLLISSTIPVKSFASDNNTLSNEQTSLEELYLGEGTGNSEEHTRTKRDRGKCTDAHTWEWCKENGYGNNRPVGGKVELSPELSRCYWTFIRKGLYTALTSAVSPINGALYATEGVVHDIREACKDV